MNVGHVIRKGSSRFRQGALASITVATGLVSTAGAGISYSVDPPEWTVVIGDSGGTAVLEIGTLPVLTIVTERFAPLRVYLTDGDDIRVSSSVQECCADPMPQSSPICSATPSGMNGAISVAQFELFMSFADSGLPDSFFIGGVEVAAIAEGTAPPPPCRWLSLGPAN